MADTTSGSGLRENMELFGRFLKSPRTIGAVYPSSPSVARAISGLLPDTSPRSVVELGAGTGALTGFLLDALCPEDRFLAIDIEPDFVAKLRRRWPALDVVCASAAGLSALVAERGMAPVDHIVSALPFGTLPAEVTRQIIDGVASTLKPGGAFTTFQYVHSYQLQAAVSFRRQMAARMGSRPSRTMEVRNVPPAFILTWRYKPDSATAPAS